MPKKILIVDDDPNILELLRLYLQNEGFELVLASDGSSALALFKQEKPDLILLDLMLPVINGREVCRMLRRESPVPIIMLTALDTTEDKLKGFEMGADDYIVKPFDPLEAVARVKALLRRSSKIPPDAAVRHITVGRLTVDTATYDVILDGARIDLKPKEFQLLLFFLQNGNMVFSREQLLEKVWGYDFSGETRTVDVHIKRLREKIDKPGHTWSIKTVWGIGYKFEVDEE